MNMLWSQCRWELLRQVRNRRFLFFTVALPLFFYFIYVRLIGANTTIQGTSAHWNAYYMMSMATFAIVGASLNGLSGRVAFERTQGWLKLVQTTPLPTPTYALGKVVAQLMIGVLLIVVMYIAGGVFENVQMSTTHWITTGIWMVIGSLPFVALGIVVGLVAGIEAAQVIGSGLYFLLSILGGLWWPVAMMPTWLRHISEWTPTYRMADVGWHLIGGQAPPVSDYLVTAAYFVIFLGFVQWLMRWRDADRD